MNSKFIGIEAFKRLPSHSSPAIQDIGEHLKFFTEMASETYARIHRVTNLEEFISAKRVEEFWDDIAALKQALAGLDQLRHHFASTMADGDIELAQHRAREHLSKALRELGALSEFVAR